MKVVTKDNVQTEREKRKKLQREKYNIQKNNYLEDIKASNKFQKFVVEDILQQALNELKDLSQIPNGSFKDAEELRQIVLANRIAQTKLEKVIGQLR